jgi:hypothetical protein
MPADERLKGRLVAVRQEVFEQIRVRPLAGFSSGQDATEVLQDRVEADHRHGLAPSAFLVDFH